MSQVPQFKYYEGAGISGAAATTAKEREKLQEQFKAQERRARDEFIRQQYEAAKAEERLQVLRGDRASLLANIANVIGTGEAVASAVAAKELNELFVQSAKLNSVETPIVNQWASRTTNLPNNPFQDPQTLSGMVGPNGEQLFSDPFQAQNFFRNQAMLAAVYQHYRADEATRTATDQHLKTAREVIDAVFPRKETAVANTQVNPSEEVERAQQLDQARQALDLRVTLQKEVTRTAIAAGMEQEQAEKLAAEVTAAFLHEQAQRHQILLEMKQEQARAQEELRQEVTKDQAIKEAAAQRESHGVVQSRPAENLDAKTRAALDEQRAKAVQLNPDGTPKDPTKFADGAYVDPNRGNTEQDNREVPNTGPVLDYHEVRAFKSDGTPDREGDWIQKDVGAAATSSLGHSRDAKSPSTKPGQAPSQRTTAPVVAIDRGEQGIDAVGIDPPVRQFGQINDNN